MAIRATFAVLLLTALAACAAPRWTKPGVTQDQANADFSDCNAIAREANRRDSDIDADILASRGHDWQTNGTLAAHQDVFAAEAYHRTDVVLDGCMRSKGYIPSK